MSALNSYGFKRKEYMPVFPRATGKPTVYIEGYPSEDDEPMAATGFHGVQIRTFSDQLPRYFSTESAVYIGIDSFIYYYEGDRTKFVAPDIYVVLGAEKYPGATQFLHLGRGGFANGRVRVPFRLHRRSGPWSEVETIPH